MLMEGVRARTCVGATDGVECEINSISPGRKPVVGEEEEVEGP